MGDLVLEVVRKKGTAAGLVRELVETFPLTFNDVHTYKGETVYLYKKAQLVTGMPCLLSLTLPVLLTIFSGRWAYGALAF